MSADDDKIPFLSRWSQRKLEAKETLPGQIAQTDSPVQVAAALRPAEMPELPPVASLDGLKSEYRDFLHPQVDEKLRRNALKKLFGDPHFNTMDMLDTYVDDYSIADPIPEAMLKQMVQSRTLALFDEDEKESEGEAGVATDGPVADAAQPAMAASQPQTMIPTAGGETSTEPETFIPDTEK